MSILKPTRVDETRRLVSPDDKAIDVEASGSALDDYRSRKALDASALQFKEDVKPEWFVVRAVTESEMKRAGYIAYGNGALVSTADAVLAYGTLTDALVRYGLCGVEVDDKSDKPERVRLGSRHEWHGLQAWSVEAVERIPQDTRGWLGSAIKDMSELNPTNGGSAG